MSNKLRNAFNTVAVAGAMLATPDLAAAPPQRDMAADVAPDEMELTDADIEYMDDGPAVVEMALEDILEEPAIEEMDLDDIMEKPEHGTLQAGDMLVDTSGIGKGLQNETAFFEPEKINDIDTLAREIKAITDAGADPPKAMERQMFKLLVKDEVDPNFAERVFDEVYDNPGNLEARSMAASMLDPVKITQSEAAKLGSGGHKSPDPVQPVSATPVESKPMVSKFSGSAVETSKPAAPAAEAPEPPKSGVRVIAPQNKGMGM